MADKYNVRASSFASFFDCAYRWEGIHLLDMYKPSTAPAAIGTAVHHGTALYDSGDADIMDASEATVEMIRHPDDEVVWGDMAEQRAIEIGLGVLNRYCKEISPEFEFEYIEETLDPLEVETDSGIIIVLTGTMDRLIHHSDDKRSVADVKTGARAMTASDGKHKAQVGIYSMLAENHFNTPVEGNEIILKLQTSANFEAGCSEVKGARDSLLGDEYHMGLIDQMGVMLKNGIFPANSQSWLCSDKYCPRWDSCIYR